MIYKPEIRMPKSDKNSKSDVQMPAHEVLPLGFLASDFSNHSQLSTINR